MNAHTDPSSVRLVPVTAANFRAVIKLDLEPDQRSFVATNVYSIAQSKVEPWWETFAVEAAGELVGFVMFGLEPGDGVHWICRLMIDQRYQRRGFGRAVMQEVLADLDSRNGCDEVRISFAPENHNARALYESLGFEDPNLIVDGEVVLVRPRPSGDR